MSKEQFEETDGTSVVRDLIVNLVAVRAEISKIAKYLKDQNPDYENAVAEIEEAIDNLYSAEKNLGEAHQYILVANALMEADMN